MSDNSTRRTRRRPGENRLRLLKAGLIEFGLHGFHGASTAAIARRAGVPQPHVYANFSDKQDLFVSCFHYARTLLCVDTRSPSDSPSPASRAAPTRDSEVRSDTFRGHDTIAAAPDAELFLFQAVAGLGNEALVAAVSADLNALVDELGGEWQRVLERASQRLLAQRP